MHKLGIIFLQVFSLLISNASLFAQQPQYTVPSNPSLRRLILSNEDIGFINYSPGRYIKLLPIVDTPFMNYGQDLIKSKKDLFIYLNASGIVYKFKNFDKSGDSLTFIRIDSTEHFGYNIDCYPFIYKNTLYNIGGYGFWRWTGHLRIFRESLKQWDIAKVNREVPVIRIGKPSIWYNAKDGKLITLSHLDGNEAEKDVEGLGVKQIDSVMMLDLEKRDWKTLGILHPAVVKNFSLTTLIANTNMGLFVNNNGNVELWNLEENKIYRLKDASYAQIFNALNWYNYIWSEDSTLYLGNKNIPKIDSIVFSNNNLIPTENKIYVVPSFYDLNKKNLATASASLFFIGVLLYGLKKRKVKDNYIKKINQDKHLQTSYPNQHIYSSIELDLISLLISNCKVHNRFTSVDELNHLLGMTNKSIEMQKRKRSDCVRSINEKFALVTKNEEAILIKRKKADTDGRLNEFYISEEDINHFQDLIN